MHFPLAFADPDHYSWSEEFRAFTLQHWIVVGVCLLITIAWCVVGRALLSGESPNYSKERTIRHWVGWFIVISQSLIFLRRFLPGQWDLDDSLPLHMCRWTVWIVAWAMLTLDRRARSMTLFWGLGLSTQVFFTPFLKEGHGSLAFWIYWLNHLQIVGVAIYDIVVLGYRPTLKDLRFGILTGIGFAVLVFILNILLGTNYAYLGSADHDSASIIDKLGPYPYRAIWMVVGSAIVMIFVYLISLGSLTLRTRVLKKSPPRFIGPEHETRDI
ncbi:MAG: TIGR02206 family membrane protein [Phycisphaerales bacterium]|nr:TIGR02206 family membrane protein [Phycisphaerales bacterium]